MLLTIIKIEVFTQFFSCFSLRLEELLKPLMTSLRYQINKITDYSIDCILLLDLFS